MPNTRYRRGKAYSADMAMYMRQLSEENTNEAQVNRLKRNLIRCMKEEITERQRTVLLMYYGKQMSQQEIGEILGVDRSSVSRTIMRGEQRLKRCLRYGAERYLRGLDEE